MIAEAGATPLPFPVIEIQPIRIGEHEHEQLRHWQSFDLALFVSANAVRQVLPYIDPAHTPRLGAIGAKTAAEMADAGLEVGLVPPHGYNSEALLALPELRQLRSHHVLILKGEGGRDLLRRTLLERGAQVTELALYHRGLPRTEPGPINRRGGRGQIHLVAVTSVEGLTNLQNLLGIEGRDWLRRTPLLAGSARIADEARRSGFEKIHTAPDPDDESMFRAVLQWNEENKA